MEKHNIFKARKSSPRLKNFNYQGNYAYFITCCTNKKEKFFSNPKIINEILTILKAEALKFSFKIFAYCFMPDHLHLLLVGGENSNLNNFMKNFKQKSGFNFKHKYNKNLWERSYYDHILRKEENLKDTALYIFNNPVRKGIVNDYNGYPFLGSMVFDINEL